MFNAKYVVFDWDLSLREGVLCDGKKIVVGNGPICILTCFLDVYFAMPLPCAHVSEHHADEQQSSLRLRELKV